MKRTQSFMKTKQPRRGALLLVVLSILVLFALVGLTFVVSALAFNTGAQANLERDSQAGDASNEADAAIRQLLRGPRAGTSSVILGHSLLRDMWGNQSVVVTGDATEIVIERPEDSAGTDIAQLWEIEVAESLLNPPPPYSDSALFRVEQYYTGSVLTFTEGELKGQSHRILHYRLKFGSGATPEGVVFVIDQDPIVARENLIDLNGDGGIEPEPGDDFVVNDPAFNGTGFGFDPTSTTNKRTLGLLDGTDPVALLPNISNSFPTGLASGFSIEAGGADEPYDTPDYQNMFLSYLPQDVLRDVSLTLQEKTNATLPSFHRQDLLEYWVERLETEDATFAGLSDRQKSLALLYPYGFEELQGLTRVPGNTDTYLGVQADWDITTLNDRLAAISRKTILRPTPLTHPKFASNRPDNLQFDPLAKATESRWDIDNDLDGIPDSIWIDIGLPLKTDRQGRRYKPLAAIMVKDMDALINVNAHGSYAQFASFEDGTFPGTPSNPTTLLLASDSGNPRHSQYSPSWDSTGSTPLDMQLVMGSGYGPADVSLGPIFSAQNAFDLLQARYQPAFSPPAAEVLSVPRPGRDTDGSSLPGDDERSRMDNIGLIDSFAVSNSVLLIDNRFGSPPDRLGLGRTYIDYAGRPRLQPQVEGTALGSQPVPVGFGQRANDPYEFDPLHAYRYDSPFTYQELERVLRYEEYDSSSVTPSDDRLMELASNSLSGNPAKRRLITTASFQVPTANRVDIPSDLRDEDLSGSTPQNMMFAGKTETQRRPAPTLVSLLQERLRQENGWDPSVPAQAKLLKDKVYQLLPPEIFRGEPFDLNRLLEAPADGLDNDMPADGVIDDIFELQRHAEITFQTSIGSSGSYAPNSQFVNWLDGTTGVGCNPPVLPAIGPANPTSYSASRQLMARYLYVMVLLLMEDDYLLPTIHPDLMLAANIDQRRELTKRRIAQWAINVVDFRDRDAVMTPFEYDLNPFTDDDGSGDTWNVNGNLKTDVSGATGIEGGATSTYRRVVWGAESPELVLTETLAFHDRRTKDTQWDADGRARFGTDKDDDLDQYRIPQGSLFIEMYNPRNLDTNNNFFPPELYDLGSNFGLALDLKTPGGDPVWRIVITQTELDSDGGARANVIDEIAARPDTINFQARDAIGTTADPAGFAMDGTNVSKEPYDIERIILFTKPTLASGTTEPPANVFYYPGNAARRIVPDSYAVIGPRQTTYIGSKPRANMGMTDYKANDPGAQSIILSGASEGVYVSSNMLAPTGGARKGTNQDFAVVARRPDTITTDDAAHDPDGAPGGGKDTSGNFTNIGIGLNVSEPLSDNYYPEPTVPNTAPNLAVYDLYTDGDAATVPIPDVPFDTEDKSPAANFPLLIDPSVTSLHDTGTYPDKSDKTVPEVIKDYKTAILQRLANPLSNFDAISNPYVSVDQLGIDLTVFNGEDSFAAASAFATANSWGAAPPADQWDPDENGQDPRATTSTDVYFASREKGRRDDNVANDPAVVELEGSASTPSFSSGNYLGMLKRITGAIAGNVDNMIQEFNQTPPIHQSPVDPGLVTGDPITDEHFGRKVVHTLGYVNHNLGEQIGTGVANEYLASPNPLETGRLPDPYDSSGTPFNCENNPLSYIHWPNAPFVSEYDLMMVPTSSPQRLLFEYSGARKNDTNSAYLPFYFDSGTTNGDSLDAQLAPYAYLFNFFHGTATDTPPSANSAKAMQLARLFDFVHVPSRFNGTKKWFDYTQFNPTVGTSGELRNDPNKTEDARLGYMFPFNRVSEFREPGKINLNTISSEAVYNSIFDPDFWQNTTDFDFATWTEFRESRRGYTGTDDPAYPSRFSNPFRPAAAAELMPVLHGSDKRLMVPPEEAGLLRSVDRNVTPKSDRVPLFDLKLNDLTLGNDKMRHYRTDDNPMLRYQAYQRLGNIAGTQSNVFAVWVTIGYFEVEPIAVSPTHPDGWALGEELGNDTGEINRHRSFYIIDRSIPVGYVPGEDLNVEDTIMLKRFIE